MYHVSCHLKNVSSSSKCLVLLFSIKCVDFLFVLLLFRLLVGKKDVEELSTRVQENLEHIRRTVEEEERLSSEFARDFNVQPSADAITQLEEIKKQLEAVSSLPF